MTGFLPPADIVISLILIWLVFRSGGYKPRARAHALPIEASGEADKAARLTD